jgi:hypothetical protein
MDLLGTQVVRHAWSCLRELEENQVYLFECYQYLVKLSAMMSVARAAHPLFEQEVRRNPRSQVVVTGEFSKAGDMIEPVGRALRAYYARNFQ